MNPMEAAEIPLEDLKAMPFFGSFAFRNLVTTEHLSSLDRWVTTKVLAEAIPALTFAVGSNEVDTFEGNVNINEQRTVGADWPRGFRGGWDHSDIKDIPLQHVYNVFESMLREGRLK